MWGYCYVISRCSTSKLVFYFFGMMKLATPHFGSCLSKLLACIFFLHLWHQPSFLEDLPWYVFKQSLHASPGQTMSFGSSPLCMKLWCSAGLSYSFAVSQSPQCLAFRDVMDMASSDFGAFDIIVQQTFNIIWLTDGIWLTKTPCDEYFNSELCGLLRLIWVCLNWCLMSVLPNWALFTKGSWWFLTAQKNRNWSIFVLLSI